MVNLLLFPGIDVCASKLGGEIGAMGLKSVKMDIGRAWISSLKIGCKMLAGVDRIEPSVVARFDVSLKSHDTVRRRGPAMALMTPVL